jgi:Leucine-rich repeat (LRR) protein
MKQGEYVCLDISGLGLEALSGLHNGYIPNYESAQILDAAYNELGTCMSINGAYLGKFNRLRFLNLRDNKLKQMPDVAADDSTALTHVNLSDNPGLLLGARLNKKVEVLLADNCGMTALDGHPFQDVARLRILSVNDNEITEIPAELRRLRSLKYIYAERNRLSSPQQLSHGTIPDHHQKTAAK